MSRTATRSRTTSESEITVTLDLDGTGLSRISTGVGFYDHMLTALSRHSLIDLDIQASGDVHIDGHHVVEDTAIVLGQALGEALGDKHGIRRYADATVPLDEALALSTGTTRENIRNNYNKTTRYARPPISIGVSDVEVGADGKSANVTVCYDRTKMTVVDENGNDVTKDSSQNKIEYLIGLVDGESDVWLAESQTTLSSNECSTEQK